MKISLLFLPIVIGYNNYNSKNNSDLLVCENKSKNALNLQMKYLYAVRLYIFVNMIYLFQNCIVIYIEWNY